MLLFAGAAILLILIPGPNTLYIATRSISQGTRAGIASALGVETGTIVHILAATFGLSALIAASSIAFDVVRYAGAAYLIYLGIRTLMTRAAPIEADAASALPLRRIYASGIFVNLLNVKVALFFLALLPQFVNPDRGLAATQMLALGAVLILIGLAYDLAWAFAGGTLSRFILRHPKAWSRQKYVVGPIYVGLGLAAAFGGSKK